MPNKFVTHSHNLVLICQPPLLQSLALTVNEEIRSRVTYSVILPSLGPDATEAFILAQLDRAGLGAHRRDAWISPSSPG